MKKILLGLTAATALLGGTACSSNDDIVKDTEKPVISEAGIVANPIDCQEYNRGESIPFQYLFTDNEELGNYNIEIHHNFDQHTHGTQGPTCKLDEKKQPVKPWIYTASFAIPSQSKTYKGRQDIQIPKDIDPGDYHFVIRVTDKAGNQQLKAMAIKLK